MNVGTEKPCSHEQIDEAVRSFITTVLRAHEKEGKLGHTSGLMASERGLE